MKKNVFFLLMCAFAMTGIAQAQNRGEIQVRFHKTESLLRVLGSPTSAIIRHHKSSASECPSIGVTCSPPS